MKTKLSQLVKYYVLDENDDYQLVEQDEANELIIKHSDIWRNLSTLVRELVKTTAGYDEPITLSEIQSLVENDDEEYPLIVPNDPILFATLTDNDVEIDLD